jgi:glycine oxidase
VSNRSITVRGAGVLGLWQALTLARAGHRVRLVEASAEPFARSASLYAAAMLAPDREADPALPLLREFGRAGLAQWQAVYPGLVSAGALVVAGARDRPEFERFARITRNYDTIDAAALKALEPDLEGRFAAALHFPEEAHMAPAAALAFLLAEVQRAGGVVAFGAGDTEAGGDMIVDCRGLAARDSLPDLRGVRGERIVVRTREIALSRPVQLLHPRIPLYIVPWGDGLYMIGATVLETEDAGPVTVRSALELLSGAYAVHPAFAEAEILDLGAGVRPSFPDNLPRVVVRDGGRRIFVNGSYRHGYLLAPVLAGAVADYIATGATMPWLHVET